MTRTLYIYYHPGSVMVGSQIGSQISFLKIKSIFIIYNLLLGKISFFSGKYTLPETNLCVPSVCFSGATAQHCKLSLTNSGSEEPFFRKRRQVLSTDASYCHQENQEHEFLLHLQNSS